MSFILFWDPVWDTTLYLVVTSSLVPLGCGVFHIPCFNYLDSFENYWSSVCRMFHYWILYDVFHMKTEIKCYFHHRKCLLSVWELDKGEGWEYGYIIAWFKYHRHAFRQVVCYLKEVANFGQSNPSLGLQFPSCQSIIKWRKWKVLLTQNNWSFYCLPSSALFRISYNWHYIICRLFRFSSFPQQHVLKVSSSFKHIYLNLK